MQNNETDIIVKLSDPQDAILNCRQALNLDMAGQGAGKTRIIGIDSAEKIRLFPRANGFIGANTYNQLSTSTLVGVFRVWSMVYGWEEFHPQSNLYGEYVVDKKPPGHFKRLTKVKDYKNTVSFRDGTLIFLGSLDNYKVHDGKEFAWAHLDETKDTKEEALTDVIFGRLRQVGIWYDENKDLHWETDVSIATANGWTSWCPLYIHTSPAFGIAEWINKMFDLNEYEDQIRKEVYKKEEGFYFREFKSKSVCIYSSYHNAEFLAPNFFTNQIDRLSPSKADKLIFGLPFSKNGGEYYPRFERRDIVTKVYFIPGKPVHLSFDFNGSPYMTCLLAQVETLTRYIDQAKNKFDHWSPGLIPIEVTRVRIFKEYCLEPPYASTEEVCEKFVREYDEERPEIYYYGDGSGLSKIAGLGSLTNFKIVERVLDKYIHNLSKRVRFPNVAPLSRRDLLDNIFAGKYPEIELVIDESCVKTILDLEKLKQGKDGKLKKVIKNKETGVSYEELGHTSDALEYFVSELFKEYLKK